MGFSFLSLFERLENLILLFKLLFADICPLIYNKIMSSFTATEVQHKFGEDFSPWVETLFSQPRIEYHLKPVIKGCFLLKLRRSTNLCSVIDSLLPQAYTFHILSLTPERNSPTHVLPFFLDKELKSDPNLHNILLFGFLLFSERIDVPQSIFVANSRSTLGSLLVQYSYSYSVLCAAHGNSCVILHPHFVQQIRVEHFFWRL